MEGTFIYHRTVSVEKKQGDTKIYMNLSIGFDNMEDYDRLLKACREDKAITVFDDHDAIVLEQVEEKINKLNAAKPPAPQSTPQPPAQGPTYTQGGKLPAEHQVKTSDIPDPMAKADRFAREHAICRDYMKGVGFKESQYGYSKAMKVADGWMYFNINFDTKGDMLRVKAVISKADKTKVYENDEGFPDSLREIGDKCQDLINNATIERR